MIVVKARELGDGTQVDVSWSVESKVSWRAALHGGLRGLSFAIVFLFDLGEFCVVPWFAFEGGVARLPEPGGVLLLLLLFVGVLGCFPEGEAAVGNKLRINNCFLQVLPFLVPHSFLSVDSAASADETVCAAAPLVLEALGSDSGFGTGGMLCSENNSSKSSKFSPLRLSNGINVSNFLTLILAVSFSFDLAMIIITVILGIYTAQLTFLQ